MPISGCLQTFWYVDSDSFLPGFQGETPRAIWYSTIFANDTPVKSVLAVFTAFWSISYANLEFQTLLVFSSLLHGLSEKNILFHPFTHGFCFWTMPAMGLYNFYVFFWQSWGIFTLRKMAPRFKFYKECFFLGQVLSRCADEAKHLFLIWFLLPYWGTHAVTLLLCSLLSGTSLCFADMKFAV